MKCLSSGLKICPPLRRKTSPTEEIPFFNCLGWTNVAWRCLFRMTQTRGLPRVGQGHCSNNNYPTGCQGNQGLVVRLYSVVMKIYLRPLRHAGMINEFSSSSGEGGREEDGASFWVWSFLRTFFYHKHHSCKKSPYLEWTSKLESSTRFFSNNRCMKVCVKILIGSKTAQKRRKVYHRKKSRKLRRDGMWVNWFILFYL